MKKTITKLMLLLGIATIQNVEAQNPLISLPPKYLQAGATYSLPIAPAGSGGYNGISSNGPHNMYVDANNQPLLFSSVWADINSPIETTTLFNKRGFKIGDLTQYVQDPIGGNFELKEVKSNNETIILPDPGNCEQFYVIGTAEDFATIPSAPNDGNQDYFPFYALVNMGGQIAGAPVGETGIIITPGMTSNHNIKNLYDLVPNGPGGARPYKGSIKIAVTKSRYGPSHSSLLFVYNDYYMYTFKITATGIQFVQSNQIAGSGGSLFSFGGASYDNLLGEMEIYEEENLIKFAVPISNNDANNNGQPNLGLFEMSTNSNPYIFSNPKNVCVSICSGQPYYDSQIGGVEFSANGRYIYFTHEPNGTKPNPVEWVEYANISNRGAVAPSGITMTDFQRSQIELGIDGMMYFVSSNRLAAISNSNNPSTTITYPYNSSVYSWNNSVVSLVNYPAYQGAYLLPDQIDLHSYGGFYNNSIVCCYLYSPFEIEKDFYFPAGTTTVGPTFPVTVNGKDSQGNNMSVTFNSTTRTKGNIYVPAGANVTFNNLRLEFAPISTNSSGAKLVVNRFTSATGGQGGKLTTNASTLTVYGGCENNKMWPGVEILGYNQSGIGNQGSFSNSVQGRVKLNTGSVIEHAVTGLSIGTGVGNDGGGVVEGLTCTIQNCQRGLRMYPATYITSNQTVFNNSIFQINQILKDNVNYPPYAMVDVNDVKTLKFYGCTFQDLNLSYNRSVYGIVSNTTQLLVDRYLASDTYKSKFINLNHGIWAQSTIPSRAITCNKAEFTTNLVGAYLTTINVSTFTNNIFKMADNLPSGQFSVGLATNACDAYNISDNRFQNNSVSVASNFTIGCKIEESNPNNSNGANMVFRNTFENLHFGCQAVGNNAVPNDQLTNDIGLKFYCNTFSGTITWANIAVTSGKIDYHQGFVDYAAENKFSHTAVGSDYLQHSGVPNIEYNWKQNTVLNITKPTINVSSSVFVTERTTHNNTCTTQGGGGSQRLVNQTSNNVLSNIETKRALLITSKSKGTTNASVAKSTDEDSQIRTEIDMLYQEVIREYANDTINPNAHDSAMVWIDRYLKEKEVSGALLRNKLEQNREKESGTIYNSLLNAMGYNNNTRMHEILKYLDNKDIRTTLLTEPVLLNDVLKIAEDTLSDESFLLSQSVLANLNVMHPHHNYEGFDLSGASMKVSNIQESISSVYKLSNFPNPFTGKTTLTAFVPKGSNDASIVITDVLGKEVAKYTLIEGNNAVQFDKQEVKGILYYSLFIDGARKETKMMMKQ